MRLRIVRRSRGTLCLFEANTYGTVLIQTATIVPL
jgi:hypothetical protein